MLMYSNLFTGDSVSLVPIIGLVAALLAVAAVIILIKKNRG
jgi:LPXTG-motif cell wall-anchored protein